MRQPERWREGRARLAPVLGLLLAAAVMTGGITWPGGTPAASAAPGTPNRCGCYQDGTGACYCGKQAKCGCPGSCEPKGCEEKRDKQLQKEIEAETKRAQQAGRKYTESKAGARPAPEQREATREPSRKGNTKVVRMTAAQKKELLRLLALYAAEQGEHKNQTLEQIRGQLTEGME